MKICIDIRREMYLSISTDSQSESQQLMHMFKSVYINLNDGLQIHITMYFPILLLMRDSHTPCICGICVKQTIPQIGGESQVYFHCKSKNVQGTFVHLFIVRHR